MRYALSVLFLLCACAPAPPMVASSSQALATCRARGGTVEIVGLSVIPSCLIPYPDGGRFCSDSAQCAGHCLAAPAANGRLFVGPGRTVSGQCESYQPVGSEECGLEVRSGRVAPGCAGSKDPI